MDNNNHRDQYDHPENGHLLQQQSSVDLDIDIPPPPPPPSIWMLRNRTFADNSVRHPRSSQSQNKERSIVKTSQNPSSTTVNGRHRNSLTSSAAKGSSNDQEIRLKLLCDIIHPTLTTGVLADSDTPEILNSQSSSVFFRMHQAAEKGQIWRLSKMLDAGKNPLQRDFKGRTALHYASQFANQQKAMKMVTIIVNCKFLINPPMDQINNGTIASQYDASGENGDELFPQILKTPVKTGTVGVQHRKNKSIIKPFESIHLSDMEDVIEPLMMKMIVENTERPVIQLESHLTNIPRSVLVNPDKNKVEDAIVTPQRNFREELINAQDHRLETALHLAAKCGHRKVVQFFLFQSADVNLKSVDGKEPLDLIYEHVPQAICAVFDGAVTYVRRNKYEDVLEQDNPDIFLDFGSIVGYGDNSNDKTKKVDTSFEPESALLAYSQSTSKGKCKEILIHPLVQLFLHFKWKKIRHIFWISIAIHIIWSLVCTAFLISLYINNCPYDPDVAVMNLADNETKTDNSIDTNESHTAEDKTETSLAPHSGTIETNASASSPSNRIIHIQCVLSSPWIFTTFATIALIMSASMLFKEIYEFMTMPPKIYLKRLENIGQLSLILCMILSSIPVLKSWVNNSETITIDPWNYQAAAFAIFLAWTLILSQVGKTPMLGIYIEIFSKVMKSFAFFGVTFISLLTAFALAFNILMPQHPAFQSWPLSMCKVLMMMTGELEYDQFFYDGDSTGDMAFFVTGHILFVTFTVIVTIILFNLLIGLTVSDIQGLQQDAKISGLGACLERIHMMESFLQRFTKLLKIDGRKLKLHIAQPSKNDELGMEVSIKDIPEYLQHEVRELAMSNLSSSEGNGGGEGECEPEQKEDYNPSPAPAPDNIALQNQANLIEAVVREVLRQQYEARMMTTEL